MAYLQIQNSKTISNKSGDAKSIDYRLIVPVLLKMTLVQVPAAVVVVSGGLGNGVTVSSGLGDEGLCNEGDKEGAKLKLPWWALSACCPFVGVVSWLLVQVPVVGVVVSGA